MIFADTGYFNALFTPRDQVHERALNWSAVINEPLVTTEYVLWECINALSKPRNRASAHALVDQVMDGAAWECVSASTKLWESGLQLHRAHLDKSWSLTDCISFHVMRSRGIQRALAHDEHFAQAGFEALLRRQP